MSRYGQSASPRRTRGSLFCAMAMLSLACGGGSTSPTPPPPPPPPPPAAVALVEVEPSTRTLTVGETVQLTATAKTATGAVVQGREVTWSSLPTSVASVSNSGLVTAISGGEATVTAAVDGRTGVATITVSNPLPAPSCRECLEVVPGSLLLTSLGAQTQLAAYLVDAAGARTLVNATFSSARPGVVSVTPGGLATAVAFGSAKVTAQGGGRTSEPVTALVATPVAGAMVVTDDRIDGTPQPVDPDAEPGIGYRYTIRLRGAAPAVGQMMVGAGSLPVLGRVERVTAMAGGISEVELQVRPVAEILPNFSLNETWQLAVPPTAGGARAGPSGGAPRAIVQRPLEDGEFLVGPMTCKAEAEAGLTIPLALQVEALELNPVLSANLIYINGDLSGLVLSGELRPRLILTPRVQVALEASLTCKVILYELPIRVTGPLSLVISPKVPVGLGFKLGGTVPAQVGARIGVEGVFRLSVAWACVNGHCAQVVNPEATVDGIFEPLLGGPVTGQVDLSASVFAFAEVEVDAPAAEALGSNVEVKILEAIGGLRQTITVAPPLVQAQSPTYASRAALELFYEAKSELKVELGSLWRVQAWEASFSDAHPLAQTPQGFLQATPTSVTAGTQAQPGEPVLFRVNLNSTTWLTLNAVEGVEIFWSTPGGLVSVCGFMEPAQPMQSEYECELTFLDTHVGTQTFYAFVTARIYGAPFGTPFEIAPEAKVVIQVVPPLSGGTVYFDADTRVTQPDGTVLCIQEKILGSGTVVNLSSVASCSGGTATATHVGSLLVAQMTAGASRGATTPTALANAQMDVEDMVVIHAPGLAGTQGSFAVRVEVTGSLSVTGPCSGLGNAGARWELGGVARPAAGGLEQDLFNPSHPSGGVARCVPGGTGLSLPQTLQGTPVTFTYGVPFALRLFRGVHASAGFGTTPIAWAATVDVTFRWLGMTGLPVGATLTSATGVDWSKPAPP